MLLIDLSFAEYQFDEDINMLENNIINVTELNATYVYQNGTLVSAITNGTGLSLSGGIMSATLSYWQGIFVELTDTFGGDVSGTYDNIVVADNSHTHAYQNITNEPWIEDSQEGDLNVNHSDSSSYITNSTERDLFTNTYNGSYLTSESDPYWTANQSSYYTKSEVDSGFSTIYEPLWSANLSAHNNTWASTYNSTYDDYVTANISNETNIWDGIDTPDDFVNITASGIIKGQPITGAIGSGIINSSENLAHCGCMNVSKNQGRETHYPEFTARVIDTDGTVVDCYKAEGDRNVTDNQHSTNYLNSSCEWNSETFATFHSADLSPGGKTRVFDVYAISGEIEETKGNTLLSLAKDKGEQIRIFCSSSSHLSVCNGFEVTQDTFPAINVSSGNSVYLNTYLPSDGKSSLLDGIHITHHENGIWAHTNQTGLNITHCDNGTDLVVCTGTVFRQYPVYSISWNSGKIIHMLSPLTTGATYTSLSACTEADPDYSLPSMEDYVAVVHHIYCARRTDSAWDANAWVDLRAEPVGGGGTQDLSSYLDVYGSKELQATWDLGPYGITALTFTSDVTTGTAPLTVASTTQVTNLNSSYAGVSYDLTCTNCIGPTEITDSYILNTGDAMGGTLAFGNNPFTITSAAQIANLNASYAGTAYSVTGTDVVTDVNLVNDITVESTKNITTTAGINLGDNVKQRFGDGNDACTYWDGSSLITSTVPGDCG